MRLLTFMEMDEIEELTRYNDERMNAAKERLAYEVTKLVHGEEKAKAAEKQAKAAFGGGSAEDMPKAEVSRELKQVADVMVAAGIAKSKGEAKRLIEGGGVSVNETKITDPFGEVDETARAAGGFVLHKGKKYT